MNQVFPIGYLARHGETGWTLSGQYTGLNDLSLTERGERNARRFEARLYGLNFTKVFTSPLQRARRTCELAGFGAVAEIDPDLVESNYGNYDWQHVGEIRTKHIRVLATHWIGLEVTAIARQFSLSTASPSAVGYDKELSPRVIRLWNDTHYVVD